MDTVIWEDPPAGIRGRSTAPVAEAEALKARPNTWARVYEYDNVGTAGTTASTIKRGERRGFEPAGAFEAATRTINGKGVVYARFVGEA